ncbi:beta-glucosidase [Streptomyces sp. VRA16 Mangrove soil]|uniref:beta-glucosidase family protein n=1 Tax=Streptomyces sp. VRA16 Mangrove soil TaxID=2817434 RepID=UPI001A9CE897|nr:glycoside hydrolase family 3 C-terminal domain-containing protein [Streptomyces sp. VRA16 Mangrove soil]MBO1332896.1 glycoside hydrolase family 3 protein [Streptomyces sp. VRA16 Mangrove soil]
MDDDELGRLVEKLSLTQKVRLLTGATTWRTAAESAVGLREMVMSDGPAGVRGEAWDERRTSALLPAATAVAAMWDEELAQELGALLAEEARAKGVHVVLGPTLNLHRSPLGGRHFECFSEDPELTGRTGAALIRGIRSGGVAATAKHYVANDSETERLTVDVRVPERALHEVYLAPFEAAVAAGVQVVMSGYNGVDGSTMTASSLLCDPLKERWGFDGVVVSDWAAVRTTVASALAAQDLAMPGPESVWGEALLRAVRDGDVPESALDEKVCRILRLARRVGALGECEPMRPRRHHPRRTRALLRRAVAASTVLLANRDLLPLSADTVRTVAVIGGHAARPRLQGGGSAGVFPLYTVTPLDGIRHALRGTAEVVHAPGPALAEPPWPLDADRCTDPRTGEPGLLLRVLDRAGHELYAEHRLTGRLLEPTLVPGAHTVELGAVLRPEEGGEWTFGVGGFGNLELVVDGRVLVAGQYPRHTDDPAVVHVGPPCRHGRIHLEQGRAVEVVARRTLDPDTGRATLLTAAPPSADPQAALARAVDAARAADVAVVVVGTTEGSESEGHDRTTLALPGHQDALVAAVAAAQPRTVAVVNSGGPVELPWRDDVGALLLTWFPGQEAGAGLADVLFGRAEPGGRLPTTWAARLTDAPVTRTRSQEGVLEYTEGLHIGHRAWLRAGREPAYWFGHGLGYTTWSHEKAEIIGEPGPDGFTVRVTVRNTGTRTGRDVVQVYLAKPDSAVERPARWFAGYTAVTARPGTRATVEVTVPARVLRHWSPAAGAWRTEPGTYRLHIGRSAVDTPLVTEVEVAPTS